MSSLGSGIYGTSVPWPEHEPLCRHVTLCGSHKVNEKGGGQWCFKCGQLPSEMLLGDHVSCKCLQGSPGYCDLKIFGLDPKKCTFCVLPQCF